MLDQYIRPYIDPPLKAVTHRISRTGLSANAVTVAGFAIGGMGFGALFFQSYGFAFACLLLNRLSDGLDGALARHNGETDLGGYLDIVLDFIFYAGFVFFFVLGQPQFAIWGAFLLFCFMGTASSFLAYAIIAAKKGVNHNRQGQKSFYYLDGIAEGTETIIALVMICLFPGAFPVIASVFGVMCLLTTWGRVRLAVQNFTSEAD